MSEPSGRITEPQWTREHEDAQIERLRPIANHLRVGHDVDPDRRRYRDTWLHIALLAEEWFEEHPVETEDGIFGSRDIADALGGRGPAPEHADQTRADVVLSEAIRLAISDPGATTPRLPNENVSAWSTRVVERILADRLTAERAEHAAEVEALRWAEMLTHQECAAKKHPDWYIDSEHNIVCPWCRAEAAEAAVARVSVLADEWEANAGEQSSALQVYGPQNVSVPFAVTSIRAALDGERP